MKLINFTKFILIVAVVLIASQTTRAQYAYGLSDIVYDSTSGKVTSLSKTSLDYRAGLHYDPAVVGGMFREGILIGGPFSNVGYANLFSAQVGIRTTSAAPPDTHYDVFSDHYVVAYFYTEVIILDDPPGSPGILAKKWYDPLGFGAFGGSKDPGWYGFKGSNSRQNWLDYQFFFLGTTYKGIIANPTICSPGITAAGTCPEPLRVKILNRFKGDQDLSASSDAQTAMVGAPVQLNADLSAGTGEPVTFTWSSSVNVGDGCSASSVCVAKFDTPNTANTYYTINLAVRQGNQPPIQLS